MSDLRATFRLQREMLLSLGFACVEEEPDFSAFAVAETATAALTPPMAPSARSQQNHSPFPNPRSPSAAKRDQRYSIPISREQRGSDDDRHLAITSVISEAESCMKCGLHLTRKRTVAGEGSRDARLFVIGEIPSEDDDNAGAPFRGGELEELMTNMLKAMGFKREDVFITQAVKCRPPKGRSPDDSELECCHHFLARQIEAVHPEVIVCFGQAALQSLIADQEQRTLSKCRGRWLDYRGVAVMPTFALPYIVRNRDRKKVVWEDLQQVMRRLDG
ncbi:MAG: uracil-DNA glycosylase [Candidatus Sumerlaeota bacterium]